MEVNGNALPAPRRMREAGPRELIAHHIATPIASGAEPGSPEWHAARRTGVGGSDAATALGLSTWRSPYELYLDKLGELPPREPTDPQRWGHVMEPVILNAYARETGRRLITPRTTWRSEAHPWMIANLDAIAQDIEPRIVEAKNVRSAEGWGESGSDDIPMHYLLQVQHYMVVTAIPVADVAVLIGGQDFRVFEVHADPELQTMLVEGERDFWRRVETLDPPPPIDIEDARRRWGGLAVRGTVLATPEDLRLVAQAKALDAQAKALAKQVDEHKAALMQRLGERGDHLVDDFGRELVTWKLSKSPERFDLEAFEAEHPDLYVSYLRRGKPARRFLWKDTPQ